MSIQFDTSAMNAFRAIDCSNANAKVELQGKNGEIQIKGDYKGPLSALKRTTAEKNNNNKVRTQLLESLAKTFGMNLRYDSSKQPIFDQSFLNALTHLLGKDVFKCSDFGITDKGEVSSGKPLTARRISAILAKVDENISNIKTATYPILSHYENKLNQIAPKLGIDLKDNNLPSALAIAQNCVQLLNKVSMGTPLLSFNYLGECINVLDITRDTDSYSTSSFDQLKVQIKNLLHCDIDYNNFDISEEYFKVELDDEKASHPLEALAENLNNYVIGQVNAFLTAISSAFDKIDSHSNIDVNAIFNFNVNGDNMTIESYIQQLNSINA